MKLSGGLRTSSSQLEAPPNNIQHHSIPLIDSIFKGILKIYSSVTWPAAAPKIIQNNSKHLQTLHARREHVMKFILGGPYPSISQKVNSIQKMKKHISSKWKKLFCRPPPRGAPQNESLTNRFNRVKARVNYLGGCFGVKMAQNATTIGGRRKEKHDFLIKGPRKGIKGRLLSHPSLKSKIIHLAMTFYLKVWKAMK